MNDDITIETIEIEVPPKVGEGVQEKGEPLFASRFINPVSHRAAKPSPHIGDLLFPGYTCVYGAPKCGKTWLTLAATMSLHTGTSFLGREVRQCNVAWLELDMAEWDFQDYSEKIVRGMDIPSLPLPYFSHALVDLNEPTQRDMLCEALAGLETKVLVVDSVRAATKIKENDSEVVAEFIRGFVLAKLRNEMGISTIAIAHAPKFGTGPRGSGEWAAGADSLWEVKRPPDGAPGLLTVTGEGRHAPFAVNVELYVTPDIARVAELLPDETRKRGRRAKMNREGLIDLALEVVQEAEEDGLSQNALGKGIRERGGHVSRNDMPDLIAELGRCRGVSLRPGKGGSKVVAWTPYQE